jgi:AcrR family transcriptional regulator
MRQTQDERKADTRERLIRAAADLFVQRGVDAVSVDTIAEAAGRTSGAVYAHFGGKQGLVLAVLDRWSGEAARAISADVAVATSIRERLESAWTTFRASDDAVRLLHELWLRADRDAEVREGLASRYAESRRAMADTYAGWGVDAPEARAVHVFALLLGLDMQRRLDPDAVPDDVAVAAFTALFAHDRNQHEPKEHDHAHASV